MEFSQATTRTELISTKGQLPWQKGKYNGLVEKYRDMDCEFLIYPCCCVYKICDGTVIVSPTGFFSRYTDLRSYTVSLRCISTGQISQIKMSSEILTPGDQYQIIMQGMGTYPHEEGWVSETCTLEIIA